MQKRLVILSGPSCVGKTPLLKAVKKNFQDPDFFLPVLYSSRRPRPIEKEGVDYYFRTEAEIRSLSNDRFIVSKARHVWQGIDMEEIGAVMSKGRPVVMELYPTLATQFLNSPLVVSRKEDYEIRTVFLSPITRDELSAVKESMGFATLQAAAAAVMLPKLIARVMAQGKIFTLDIMEDLQIRASKAYDEIEMSNTYTDVIINHDGEDSRNWSYSPPVGEAGKTLTRFVEILQGV